MLDVDASQAPAVFFTDPVKLRTIIRNLVTNAIKFTERGRIEIRFVSLEGGGIAVEVADSGPGIPEESQEMIFEPFRQLDGSSTRSHGGIGLGLALSRKLARLIGGDLGVRSVPGEGSTFTLTLPPTPVSRNVPSEPGGLEAAVPALGQALGAVEHIVLIATGSLGSNPREPGHLAPQRQAAHKGPLGTQRHAPRGGLGNGAFEPVTVETLV